jgi:hypothetical protein
VTYAGPSSFIWKWQSGGAVKCDNEHSGFLMTGSGHDVSLGHTPERFKDSILCLTAAKKSYNAETTVFQVQLGAPQTDSLSRNGRTRDTYASTGELVWSMVSLQKCNHALMRHNYDSTAGSLYKRRWTEAILFIHSTQPFPSGQLGEKKTLTC